MAASVGIAANASGKLGHSFTRGMRLGLDAFSWPMLFFPA